MEHYISPSFGPEKLEAPTYDDLVDVFEDRVRNWLLGPAKVLLKTRHGQIAAMGLLIGYFESIEIYCSGMDSRNQSKAFFGRGLKRVFPMMNGPEAAWPEVVDGIYQQARCGFSHDGMFRYRIYLSEVHPRPLLVTLPKKDGKFVPGGKVESIVINPTKFHQSIDQHLTQYVKDLRASEHSPVGEAFRAAVQLKWGLDQESPQVGMTEESFLRGDDE